MKFKNSKAKYFPGVGKNNSENVLIIGAHPDDAEFMAYQIISQAYKNEKIAIHVVILTDGANSPRTGIYSSYDGETMIKVREEEQVNAMKIGEYTSLMMLNYTSGEIKSLDQRAKDDIKMIIDEIKPSSIYIHNPFDKHPTHIGSCRLSLLSINELKPDYVEHVFGCEVWQSLEWLPIEDKINSDTSLYHEELFKPLVASFVSQIAGGKNYDVALIGRWKANATFLDSHTVDLFEYVSFMCDLTPVAFSKVDLKDYVTNILYKFTKKISQEIID